MILVFTGVDSILEADHTDLLSMQRNTLNWEFLTLETNAL